MIYTKVGYQDRPDSMREMAEKGALLKPSGYKKGGMVKSKTACKKYAAGGVAKIRLNQSRGK